MHLSTIRPLLAAGLMACAAAQAAEPACRAESGPRRVPVIELFTSEGCSSCPPADRWVSGLKAVAARGDAVVQAFHVGYWDYIGWVDRFAAPAHTQRQRELGARNGLRGIYTPQVLRDGRDWRDWGSALDGKEQPGAHIAVRRSAADAFEATVTPAAGGSAWTAYWTVTEHGHSSKVKTGENAGELLQHDFVVRQYVPAGDHAGAGRLTLRAVAATPGHARQVNLVVAEPRSGRTLQALSLSCTG